MKITDIFKVVRGSGKYTKSYAQTHSGEYPVYSGNTTRAFSFINSHDYCIPCLSWVIDGLAGYIMVHNEAFSATNHRGLLLPKVDGIDLEYAKYLLEPIFRERKKGRIGAKGQNEYTSLPPYMIKDIEIDIPIDCNGKYDLVAQRRISEKYVRLNEIAEDVIRQKSYFERVTVSLDNEEYNFSYFQLDHILTTVKGKSKYTRKYGSTHKGCYPVYSASSQTPLTFIDSYDYSGKYLTWSTNGFAGTILVIDGSFSINGDRGILIPKEERDNLDLDYLKYVLEPVFRDLAKGRKGDKGQDEFTKLYPSMLNEVMIPFPIDENGDMSIVAQKAIAKRYKAVDQCRYDIIEKLDALISQKISLQ